MMKKTSRTKPEIVIDEGNHKPVRTFSQKMKDALLALGMGVILAQLVFWVFWQGSLVRLFYMGSLFYPVVFCVYLSGCAILGWRDGERFIETLNMKSGGWFNWIDPWYWK